MSTVVRRHRAVVVGGVFVAVVGMTALALLGAVVVAPGSTATQESGILEVPELGICTEIDAAPAVDPSAAAPDPCPDCPKRIPGGCFRISCDPCCYRCQGDPVPRCL